MHERPLVVLLWHRHSAEIAVDRLAWLAEVDHVMALGAGFAEFTIEGVDIERLDGSVTQLPEALKKVQADFPQSDVLLFRSGLQAPANFVLRLRALIKADERPDQLVFPGNYSVEHAESIDPLLGLGAFDEDADPDSLVSLCGDRRWQWSNAVPLDCLLLRAEGLAERADRIGLSRAALVDDFYIVDPSSPESTDRLEEAEPPLGHVRLRASELRRAGVQQLPVFRPDQQAVTLHIAHSWGGGVWRWIEDFIEGDRDSLHLVLVAVSDGPGQRCGRRLQLCALGPGRGVIREYELSPDITSTSTAHAGYDEHLRQVIERFGVGRIIVSSLIGHSLECLKTGLPTLQVLHDFYPLWPFLDYDPLPMIEAGRGIDFDRAFERYGRNMRLRPRLPEFWQGLTEAWRECIDQHAIALIAPTEHVIQRWQSMNPTMQLTIALEPHGFRPFSQAVESCEPDIDQPLHLLILGRLTTGKGLNLLKKALPELREQARLTALGCGREAFSLLGESGIDLIPNYRRDELPQLVSSLRPQAALLLSTVPETWNYTLSEIRALKLLPIATNIGSFRERIEHGVDGFLIEPQADALIDQVQGLVEQLDTLPEMIEQAMPERSLADQAGAISTRIPAHFGQLPGYRAELADQAGLSRLAADLADARASALLATKQQAEMRAELAARSQWANTMERQFRQRSQWAEQLNRDNRTLQSELSDSQQALVDQVELQQQTQQALNQTTQVLNKTTQTLEQRSAERERLQQLVDQMMASRSWRITRPLRVLNRLRHSPVLPRLFNPLNWPELVGKFFHHCRLRGLKQTLWMLQNMPQPEPEPAMVVETAVPQAGQIAEPLAFPPVEQPLISVVIPVHNQLHYTAACLHSVADAVSSSAFEVIVVNDASNDDTRRWLKRCSGITVLNNRENLGFIGSCNRGAAAACGEYLVFLNNDTKVIDHWLDRMLDLFQ
ncbi:MAG: glycosyltransferase, partial [Pseudomonadota bacterium]